MYFKQVIISSLNLLIQTLSCWLILFVVSINFIETICIINKSSRLSYRGEVGTEEVLLGKPSFSVSVTVACLLLVLAKGIDSLIKDMERISL